MQRNPYLILGVPFGTHRDDARRKFAHAARRLRRSPNGPYSVEDLTWALNEIESLDRTPDDVVDYFRVPANPAVFQTDGAGVFRPAPVRLDRRTERHDTASLEALRRATTVELLGALVRAFGTSVTIDLAFDPPGDPPR